MSRSIVIFFCYTDAQLINSRKSNSAGTAGDNAIKFIRTKIALLRAWLLMEI